MRIFAAVAIALAICSACTQTSDSPPVATAAPTMTEIPAGRFDLQQLAEMPSITKMPDQKMTREQIRETCLKTFANKRFFGRLAGQAPGHHAYSYSTILMLIRAEFDTKGNVFEDPRTGHQTCLVNYRWRDTSGYTGEGQIDAEFDGVILFHHFSGGTGLIMMPEGDELRVVVFRRPQQQGSYNAFAPVVRNWGIYRPGDL